MSKINELVVKFVPKPFRKCAITVLDFIVLLVNFGVMMFGVVLSSFGVFLILFVSYTWFTEVIPILMEANGFITTQFYTIVGLWLLGNILFNFFCTQWFGPGNPPKQLDDERKALLVDDPQNKPGTTHQFCHECNAVKPMRAHHCALCKKCVLKMDHHCPWVNTCVGWRNHKHFILFLLYMWLGSAYYVIVCFDVSFGVLFGRGRYRKAHGNSSFSMSLVLCFSITIAMTTFLGWSCFLMVTNQTTLEFYVHFLKKGKRRFNPFNLGFWRNCEEVFGAPGRIPIISWLLPSTSPPPGDGIIYPMRTPDGEIKNDFQNLKSVVIQSIP